MKPDTPELTFPYRVDFRAWLAEHGETSDGVWLVFDKTKARSTLSAGEALEEALCFGWIDGQMRRIDQASYAKYFARRRPASVWSAKNRTLVADLRGRGLMAPVGEDAVRAAVAGGRWDAPRQEQPTEQQVAQLVERLRGNSPAFENFCAMSPSVRRTYARRYLSFKSDEARERDFGKIVDRLSKNLKPM
jgi:uncharacterized protein YdeI (YjbR/CyaY-like superfamily)